MSKRVYYFADADDHRQLVEFIAQLGAKILTFDVREQGAAENQDFSEEPGCYISLKPPEDLKREYLDKNRISFGDNPILQWKRAFFRAPYLIAGDIEFIELRRAIADIEGIDHDDIKAIGKLYRDLASLIRTNWRNLEGDGFYFGPGAERRYKEGGVEAVSFIPGSVEIVEVEAP